MKIKETKKIPLQDLIFGGNDASDTSLNTFIKIVVLGVPAIISFVFYLVYLVGDDGRFITTLIISLIASGLIVSGLAILGLIGKDEWNPDVGLRMWWRVVLFGAFYSISGLALSKFYTPEITYEKVTKAKFIRSNLDDNCKTIIRVKSKHYNYDYCASEKEYNAYRSKSNFNANIVVDTSFDDAIVKGLEIYDEE
jgi:hypothetical protein